MLEITHSPSFAERTTLRLGGTCIAEIVVSEAVDTFKLPAAISSLGGRPLVLGGGSNILAADGEHPLVLIRAHFNKALAIESDEGDMVKVRVGGGGALAAIAGAMRKLGPWGACWSYGHSWHCWWGHSYECRVFWL